MKKRLLKNYLTTVLGIGVLVYCVYAHSIGSEWTELVGFFGLATLLLRSKDSLIGLPKE
jgi:cytochrome b